jgi:transposase
MDVCLVSHDGEMLVHRQMKAAPEPFLKAVAPDREGLVVAVECLFTWYWLADFCGHAGLPCGRGHALSMRAMHGGNAKHAKIDSHKIAVRLRGGMLLQAYVSPAEMRARRDLLRRRMHWMRTRAELLSHVHNPNSQYTLPEIGKNIAYQANREGVAERFDEAAGQQNIEVDLALITSDDELLRDLERSSIQTAKQHDANTLYRWQTVPGIGTLLSLVRRYAIHDMDRFPRGQDFASYSRLVTCAQASAGKRLGTSGKKIGHAPLQWTFSEAAVLCLRNHPTGQQDLGRLANKPDTGTALTILAHTLARAVYDMLKRQTAFAIDLFLRASRSSAGAPEVSLAPQRHAPASSVLTVLFGGVVARHGVHVGLVSRSRTV